MKGHVWCRGGVLLKGRRLIDSLRLSFPVTCVRIGDIIPAIALLTGFLIPALL